MLPFVKRLKIGRWLTPLMLSLMLGLMSFLLGCETQPKTDYSWVKPIYFQPETLDWFAANQPWPSSLLQDLNKIDKHNQKCRTLLK